MNDLDELAHSIALQHGMDPERLARAKEKVKRKNKMQLAYERARAEADKLFERPKSGK